jgi:hypothetical protein
LLKVPGEPADTTGAMSPVHPDRLRVAKNRISEWLSTVKVAGDGLPTPTKQELLRQLDSAKPTTRTDGTVELVLPGLSALGMGIFQHSFRFDSVRVRVVPYGNS